MRCVQRAVRCAKNIQLCFHAQQKHCDILETVAPFMDAVKEGTQRFSTLYVPSSFFCKVKMTSPFLSWAAAMVL